MKNKLVLLISFLIISTALWRCTASFLQTSTDINYDSIDENDPSENSDLTKLINPYDQAISAEMELVIGRTEHGMSKARPESLLSNFIADLVFTEVKAMSEFEADMCLLNHGGLRASLPEGEITVKDIYELMPFENEVVILELTGNKIQEIATYLNYSGGEPISGAKVKLNITPEIQLTSKKIVAEETYWVVTSDYLAKGGDKMNFFNEPISLKKTGIKLRDMIMDHFKSQTALGKTISAKLDGRITKK